MGRAVKLSCWPCFLIVLSLTYAVHSKSTNESFHILLYFTLIHGTLSLPILDGTMVSLIEPLQKRD